MISTRTFVALVGAGCIAAAGIGGYVAVRSGTSAPLTASAPAEAPRADGTGQPVQAPAAAAPIPVAAEEAVSNVPKAAPSVADSTPAARRARPEATVPAAPVDEAAPAARVEAAPATPAPETASAPVAAGPHTAAVEPDEPSLEQVHVNEGSVIGFTLDSPVSSETAQIEDRVSARVTRDVTVDGHAAIPAGTLLEGTVAEVQRAGRLKERARIGIRFTSMTLADNMHVPIQTETIFREGDPPGGEATSKIGASAVVGAILGAVIGGKKGAAIGGTAGAAGGTAAVMASGRNEVTIPAGAPLTVRLAAPVDVLVPRDDQPSTN
jgi:hypothetical protein